jgi:molybdopterin-synthase adenylyltransferase
MSDKIELTSGQLKRYDRNILLKGIGIDGQKVLLDSKVLIIGAGGLGSPAAFYLAAAGVGTLGIADFDVVDMSNLQRQIIHNTADIGRKKARSAGEKISLLNPDIEVIVHEIKIDSSNIRGIIEGYDFVIDATDNFSSKFLINDACITENKPFSHGGVLEFEGQTITVMPHKTACYRCIFGDIPDEKSVRTASMVGILGTAAGILGTIQATEAIKYVTKTGNLLTDKLLVFDVMTFDFRKIEISRNEDCPACGNRRLSDNDLP